MRSRSSTIRGKAMAPSRVGRTSESEIARAVLQIAASTTDGLATFHRLKREIPTTIRLTPDDQTQSPTRLNEELWEQQIRNIKSHHNVEGNILCEGYAVHVPRVGYKITDAGRRYIERR
jgi:hypothetical protein